jgi:ADP-ribose pyrophosphatase YjhB (NUDIX family)
MSSSDFDLKWAAEADRLLYSGINWYQASPEQVTDLKRLVARLPDDLPLHRLPPSLYAIVQGFSVTPTADFIITQHIEGGRRFGLTKRAERPWKDQFMVPGGKIAPLEDPTNACERHVRREYGLENFRMINRGSVSVLNPESQQGGGPWFSLWHLHEVQVPADVVIKPNKENFALTWFDAADDHSFIEPVRQALELIGFKSKAIAA